MSAISNRSPEVCVTYDTPSGRRSRVFSKAYEARRFYATHFKRGNNPQVQGANTMSETTTTTDAAVESTPVVKKKLAHKRTSKKSTKKGTAVKKATPKKTAKKTTSARKAKTAEHGFERSHDLPWNEKKIAIFKALKSLKATSSTNAKSTVDIAEKSGVTARDVRHYCYHAKAADLVGLANLEDVRGYAFFLTKKGVELDLKKLPIL